MIFVDTSFWIAAAAEDDTWHGEAVELYRRHGSQALVTSNLVRGETWTFLCRRYGHAVAVRFLDRLARSPRVRLARVADEHETEALRFLRRRDERPYSFVDATSFALMRAKRIREVLTFDADFAAAGFTVLRV